MTEIGVLKAQIFDMKHALGRHEKAGRDTLARNVREQIEWHEKRIAELVPAAEPEDEPEEAAWRRAAEANGYHPYY